MLRLIFKCHAPRFVKGPVLRALNAITISFWIVIKTGSPSFLGRFQTVVFTTVLLIVFIGFPRGSVSVSQLTDVTVERCSPLCLCAPFPTFYSANDCLHCRFTTATPIIRNPRTLLLWLLYPLTACGWRWLFSDALYKIVRPVASWFITSELCKKRALFNRDVEIYLIFFLIHGFGAWLSWFYFMH